MAKDDDGSASEVADLKKSVADLEKTLATVRKEKADADKQLGALRVKTDGDKTAMEKLQETVSTLEKSQKDSERRALRLEIAAEKGLSAKQARRLSGDTREELEADAAEMIEEFGISKPGENGKEETKTDEKEPARKTGETKSLLKPREKLQSGASGDATEEEKVDFGKTADSILSGL